jgi:hypothetical protein
MVQDGTVQGFCSLTMLKLISLSFFRVRRG